MPNFRPFHNLVDLDNLELSYRLPIRPVFPYSLPQRGANSAANPVPCAPARSNLGHYADTRLGNNRLRRVKQAV